MQEFSAFAEFVHHELTDKLGLPEHPVDAEHPHGEGSVDFPLIGDLDSPSFWAAFVNSLVMIIGKPRVDAQHNAQLR